MPSFLGPHARAEGSEGHGHVDDLEDRELQPHGARSTLMCDLRYYCQLPEWRELFLFLSAAKKAGKAHVRGEGSQEEVGDELEVHLLQRLLCTVVPSAFVVGWR